MPRTASLIAIVGLLTALICLPLAAALHHGLSESPHWLWSDFGDWGDEDTGSSAGEIISRDFPWGESDRLELEVPASVHFQPAPAWHLSIRGPQRTLDRLRVNDGRIEISNSSLFHRHHMGPLEVELTGPALREAALDGSGTLRLENLKQDTLSIHIRGSGSVRADGTVDALKLEILGSGSARLEHLATSSATVRIAGSGDADIAPSEDADVNIAGSGDVRLHSHAKHLNSRVEGSGRIIELPAESGSTARAPSRGGSNHAIS